MLGYDVIKIEAKERITPDDKLIIERAPSSIVGLEIIEEDFSRVVLPDKLEPSASPPKKILS